MTENIAIIMIIVFILIFGFIFYSKVRTVSIQGKLKEYSELDLVKASQIVSALPELSCSSESLTEVGCINKLKLEAFIELDLQQEYYEYYRGLFGKSKVTINSTFPNNSTNVGLYDNPFEGINNKDSIFIPINIFDPINDIFNFGYVQITKYTQPTS